MQRFLLSAVWCATLVAQVTVAADGVVTNEWINPAGGYWFETSNWKGGNVCRAGAVASVRIKDQAALRLRDKENAHCAGLCFAPYVSDESDAEPYVSTGWDTWLLRADNGTTRYNFSTGLLGYFPDQRDRWHAGLQQ